MRAIVAAVVLAAGAVAGCSLVSHGDRPIDQLPVGVKVVTPADQLQISAINQTTIPVVLVVNRKPRDMAPQSSLDLGVADLGPLPWDMRFTTVNGRELLGDTLRDGDVWRMNEGNGQGSMGSFLARADLSCGQLFLVTSFARLGPAPGPGVPGDCAP